MPDLKGRVTRTEKEKSREIAGGVRAFLRRARALTPQNKKQAPKARSKQDDPEKEHWEM